MSLQKARVVLLTTQWQQSPAATRGHPLNHNALYIVLTSKFSCAAPQQQQLFNEPSQLAHTATGFTTDAIA